MTLKSVTPAPAASNNDQATGQPPTDAARPVVDDTPPLGTEVEYTLNKKWKAQSKGSGQPRTVLRPTQGPTPATGQASAIPSNVAARLNASNVGGDYLYLMQAYAGVAGLMLVPTRDPDPMAKRAKGQTYRKVCTSPETFPPIPFDISTLISDLQIANAGSGGHFTFYLFDDLNNLVDGPFRLAVPDTPHDENEQADGGKVEKKSKLEAKMEELQMTLLERAILGGDKEEKRESITDEIAKAALPTFITTLATSMTSAITNAAQAANNNAGNTGGQFNTKEYLLQQALTNERLQGTLERVGKFAISSLTRRRNGRGRDATTRDDAPQDEQGDFIDTELDASNDDERPTISVLDYLTEKCAANEPVTFDDPLLEDLRVSDPDTHASLLLGCSLLDLDAFKLKVISICESEGKGATARLVLDQPHAGAWLAALKQAGKNYTPPAE